MSDVNEEKLSLLEPEEDSQDYKDGYKQAIKDLRIKITAEINKEIPKHIELAELSLVQRIILHLYEEYK